MHDNERIYRITVETRRYFITADCGNDAKFILRTHFVSQEEAVPDSWLDEKQWEIIRIDDKNSLTAEVDRALMGW